MSGVTTPLMPDLLHGPADGGFQVPGGLPEGVDVRPELGGVRQGRAVVDKLQSPLQLIQSRGQIVAGRLGLGVEALELGQELVVVHQPIVQHLHQVPGPGNGLRHAAGGRAELAENGGRLADVPLRQQEQVVGRGNIVVHEIPHLPRQGVGAVLGAVRVAGDPGDPAGHRVRSRLGVVQGAVDEVLEGVQFILQLLQSPGGGVQGDVRHHLSHDAAHVLAALDIAPVDAAG